MLRNSNWLLFISSALQIILILFFPIVAIWVNKKFRSISILSPIVLCFACGILVRNLQLLPVNEVVCGYFRDGTILLALPLLLYSSDVKMWIRQSRPTLTAFGLMALSVTIASLTASVLFQESIDQIHIPAGMIAGIHTGGTPNLFAVGIAFNASNEVITLTNSAQILWGAVYLLFVLSVGPVFFNRLLKSAESGKELSTTFQNENRLTWNTDVLYAILLTILIIGMMVLLSFALLNRLGPTLIIVGVTTAALALSFQPEVRELRGTYALGDYGLLMFGVAVGMLSDFYKLIEEGGPYIAFVGTMLFITVVVHVLLCRLFRLDRDTFMITSTAGIYGPVFVPQVVQVLGNSALLVGGMAVSLIGLSLGNYLGIGVVYLLDWLNIS